MSGFTLVPSREEATETVLLPTVVQAKQNDIEKENEQKGDTFWEGITRIIDGCKSRPHSYIKALEDSIGSIVQLPYQGEVILCFNTEWHLVTRYTHYHETKKELGVSMLSAKMAKQFNNRFRGKPEKKGYKRLFVFMCNPTQENWACIYVPVGVELGDINEDDPKPNFQYFNCQSFLPVSEWDM